MLFNLQASIPYKERENRENKSPYKALVEKCTSIDYLGYGCHLTTNCYLETMVRYSNLFIGDAQWMMRLVRQFFSPNAAILSIDKAVSSPSVHTLLRLVERSCHQPVFLELVDELA
jgi:hypothetical protein